jgi:hypothetical protein
MADQLTSYRPESFDSVLLDINAVWDWLIDFVGWYWRLITADITSLLFISRVNVSVGAVVMMMMPAADKSWIVYQSSLAVLPAETSAASRKNGRRMRRQRIFNPLKPNGSYIYHLL